MSLLPKSLVVCAVLFLAACSPNQPNGLSDVPQADVSSVPSDLADLLDAKSVTLISANGNGSSSGAAMEGVVRNESSKVVEIDIVMSRPVFFRNGGRGQNMIGSMVFKEGGSYTQDGRHSFVSLAPGARTNVMFIAYCADFEKDNPGPSDTFTAAAAPPELASVMSRISSYVRANPEADITVPAQVAVWLAQGIDPAEIAEKFPFTESDEQLARSFLR